MTLLTDKKGFKVLHLNIRSLWRNQHELFLHFKGFDLIALSETWLHPNIPDILVSEPGYTIFRQDRTEVETGNVKGKGGGLLLYVKDCYSDFITKIDVPNSISINLEHMWLSIDIPFRRKIILGICYRPPSGNVSTSIKILNCSLDSLDIGVHNDLLLLGDFNINYKDRSSKGFKELKDLERKFLLYQIYNNYPNTNL